MLSEEQTEIVDGARRLESICVNNLTEIDEDTAENTYWQSPSGGTWKFESELLAVPWQTKSMNISFTGKKGQRPD